MHCRFCQKVFFKNEHLRRHERSHTGSRPFACKSCGRSFGRQDSLLRHERLHTRSQPSPAAIVPVRPDTPESLPRSTSGANVPCDNPANTDTPSFVESQTQSQDSASSGLGQTPNTDLDFDLFWPDAEQLYQDLLELDSPDQWQMPLGTLPFVPEPQQLAASLPQVLPSPSQGRLGIFSDRPLSVGVPLGGNRGAVNEVSEMVASSSSSVRAAVDSDCVSSVFLDECLHMFFVKFTPVLPILHRATFIFRDYSQPLLLNAIAIGSLYLGPKDAVAKGEVLWRLAHTALATSWQTLITKRGPHDSCPGIQLVTTALLSRLYGALSKDRNVRTTSQAFHALGFFWARHCGMVDIPTFSADDVPSLDAPVAVKEHCWRTWVSREIQHRTLLAHYMVDGLVASMSGDPATERHISNPLTVPSSEAVFAANDADEWIQLMEVHQPEQLTFRYIFRALFSPAEDPRWLRCNLSAFAFKVILEGLQSLILEHEEDGEAALGTPTRTEVRKALVRVYDRILQSEFQCSEDKQETILRWHGVCLDTLVKSTLLCHSICARYKVAQQVWTDAKPTKLYIDIPGWAATPDARKALLHAIAIQDIVEQLPRGRAHAIYMPSGLFAAATVYAAFTLASTVTMKLPSLVEWKAVLLADGRGFSPGSLASGSAQDSETVRYINGEYRPTYPFTSTTRNLLYELNSMQKLFRCLYTQWGVAFDMEKVVDGWVAVCH